MAKKQPIYLLSKIQGPIQLLDPNKKELKHQSLLALISLKAKNRI
jgi:hypothetical protein